MVKSLWSNVKGNKSDSSNRRRPFIEATAVKADLNGKLRGTANQILAAMGYNYWVPKIPGQKGLRILCLDGGGSRGMTSVIAVNEMVKALGADFVIDYTRTDFTKHGKQYDVIFDTVGKITFAQCKKALTPNGRYLSSVISLPLLLQIIKTAWFGHQRALSASTGMLPAKERLKYFLELKELLQAGQIKTVIDRTYPLSQMADAHEYVEKGHKKGNVIIDVSSHPTAS